MTSNDPINDNERYPRWPLRFLQWFCPPHLAEEIEGDLVQHFELDHKKYGLSKARQKFTWNAIRYFRPGIILRNKFLFRINFNPMLSNYLKVALRVMSRNKTFSSINIFGLALGMTGALLLALWIAHEASYEQFHDKKDQLYVAWSRSVESGELICWEWTPRVLAPTLMEEHADVEHAVSFAQWDNTQLFAVGEKKILKTSGVFTNPAFLSMFSFPLVRGDAASALAGPNSIVLTEKFAKELFGERESYGETLTLGEAGQRFEFTVTGILEDLPSNTMFRFDYILPFQFLETIDGKDTFWGNNSVITLAQLREGADITKLNEEVREIEKRHYPKGQPIDIFLYPLTKMRLYANFENGVPSGGRIEVVRMLGILGVCLVAIACINFINLSTARAQRRSKEVAVRKVTGAFRGSLIMQFLCESILISVGAGILALATVYMVLPVFNFLVEQQLSLETINLQFWIVGVAMVFLIGCIAGAYPSLYLSSFKPVSILKGTGSSTRRGSFLRTALVVFQFGFAITLIVSALVVRKQIQYVQNREAGYNRDNLLYMDLVGDLGKNYNALRNDLLTSGLAVSVTKTSAPMTEQWSSTTGLRWRGKDPENRIDFERFFMDQNGTETMGLEVVLGRDLDLDRFPADSSAALINETAANVMGFKNPIGEVFEDGDRKWTIVGVVKDFVLTSPFQRVEPMVLMGAKLDWAFNVVYIKLNNERSTRENLNKLATLSTNYNPDYPFEYHFADAEYARKFANVESTLTLTTVFTSLAIAIACMGLFGLSTFMIESKVKEIGVRKVLGGSVLSITRLLSWSSLKPVLIAIVIFSPLAYFSINWWLQSFYYRVAPGIELFGGAALAMIIIALMTIGIQTIRAAMTNPVESLKNE